MALNKRKFLVLCVILMRNTEYRSRPAQKDKMMDIKTRSLQKENYCYRFRPAQKKFMDIGADLRRKRIMVDIGADLRRKGNYGYENQICTGEELMNMRTRSAQKGR